MEALWLLIPMSALLVLALLALFGWALWRGQFDDLEDEGLRMLRVDVDQAAAAAAGEECPHP
jgi:cbb3-type cytochrome oxidase maturation protein